MPPKYAGMSGRKLSLCISVIATMGFLLFGYDRKYFIILCSPGSSLLPTIVDS